MYNTTPNEQQLIDAAYRGECETVVMWAAEGVDINAQDVRGMTPLMWAAEKGNTKLVQILVALGANLDAQNMNGDTALILAARSGHMQSVETLTISGADVSICTKYGDKTALDIAQDREYTDIVAWLKGEGCTVTYGETLMCALKQVADQTQTKILEWQNHTRICDVLERSNMYYTDELRTYHKDILRTILQDFTSIPLGRDMLKLCHAHGIQVELDFDYSYKYGAESGGRYSPIDQKVILDGGMAKQDLVFVLAHELRHVWQDKVLHIPYDPIKTSPFKLLICHRFMEADAAAFTAFFKFLSVKNMKGLQRDAEDITFRHDDMVFIEEFSKTNDVIKALKKTFDFFFCDKKSAKKSYDQQAERWFKRVSSIRDRLEVVKQKADLKTYDEMQKFLERYMKGDDEVFQLAPSLYAKPLMQDNIVDEEQLYGFGAVTVNNKAQNYLQGTNLLDKKYLGGISWRILFNMYALEKKLKIKQPRQIRARSRVF